MNKKRNQSEREDETLSRKERRRETIPAAQGCRPRYSGRSAEGFSAILFFSTRESDLMNASTFMAFPFAPATFQHAAMRSGRNARVNFAPFPEQCFVKRAAGSSV